MGSDLNITKELQEYILSHGFNLHLVQKEIIDYNTSLGDIKRMQISISQCHFLHLMVKISNIKKILEIGTFTGLSGLTMSLSLPSDGKLVTLDKNAERIKIAFNFSQTHQCLRNEKIYLNVQAWTCPLNGQIEGGIDRCVGRVVYPDWSVESIVTWSHQ